MRAAAITDVAEVNPSLPRALRTRDGAEAVPFLPMAAVSEDGRASYHERRSLAELITGHTYFERGDVIVAKITPCFENGKAAHLIDLPADFGFGSTEFHVVRPGPELDGRYLFHALWNTGFRRIGARYMTGTAGQKRLPADTLRRHRVPLPSLAEQRRIAAVLDKADGIRRKRRESLRLLDEFLRSAFLEMFGDPVRNEKGWPTMPLAELGRVVTGSTPPTDDVDNYSDAGLPFIRPAQLDEASPITASDRHVAPKGQRLVEVLPAGAVLFCGIGATIGKSGYTAVPVCVNQQIHAVILNRDTMTPAYLLMVLRQARTAIVSRATATTLPILKKSAFERQRVPTPPIGLIERYARLYDRAVAVLNRSMQAGAHAADLFDSLAQRAFGGEGQRSS
ncbi:MAG: restriction endonuclease subunit S [Gemmatimonadales bacterium]|nr:restriction endonuclease subunit S [Gemmatimonadales bacterium]